MVKKEQKLSINVKELIAVLEVLKLPKLEIDAISSSDRCFWISQESVGKPVLLPTMESNKQVIQKLKTGIWFPDLLNLSIEKPIPISPNHNIVIADINAFESVQNTIEFNNQENISPNIENTAEYSENIRFINKFFIQTQNEFSTDKNILFTTNSLSNDIHQSKEKIFAT
ncbi:hypothetical protein BB559_006761, partial [Furculomyces boomerangus]